LVRSNAWHEGQQGHAHATEESPFVGLWDGIMKVEGEDAGCEVTLELEHPDTGFDGHSYPFRSHVWDCSSVRADQGPISDHEHVSGGRTIPRRLLARPEAADAAGVRDDVPAEERRESAAAARRPATVIHVAVSTAQHPTASTALELLLPHGGEGEDARFVIGGENASMLGECPSRVGLHSHHTLCAQLSPHILPTSRGCERRG
jgi:hypothetical protein